MSSNTLIVGSGAEARITLSLLEVDVDWCFKRAPVFYVDADFEKDCAPYDGVNCESFPSVRPMFRGTVASFLAELDSDDLIRPWKIVRGVGDNVLWYKAAELLKKRGFAEYRRLAAEDAWDSFRMAKKCKVGGSTIHHGVHFGDGSKVGDGCLLNTRVIIEHDVTVDDGAFVAPNSTLLGACSIGKHTFIGAGSVVFPGVSIGDWCVVAAGSVVKHDVPDGSFFQTEFITDIKCNKRQP